MLDEYKQRLSKFRDPKCKKKTLWKEISDVMKQNGYSVNADALDKKMRNMKNTYRTILDNNNKRKSTGKGRIQWEYFSLFEDMLRDDKTVNATPVMSSIIPSEDCAGSSGSTSLSISHNDQSEPNPVNCVPSPLGSGTETPLSSKRAKAKQLDAFRKRQLDIEEEKVAELKRLRKLLIFNATK